MKIHTILNSFYLLLSFQFCLLFLHSLWVCIPQCRKLHISIYNIQSLHHYVTLIEHLFPDSIVMEMESETPSNSHLDNQSSPDDILDNTSYDFNFVTVILIMIQPWILYHFVLVMLQSLLIYLFIMPLFRMTSIRT